MNRLVLTLASVMLIFSACTKKGDDPVSVEDELRQYSWVRTTGSVTYKDPATKGDSTRSYLIDLPPCENDNRLEFKANFDGALQMGTLKCVSGEPDSKKFTWQVVSNGQKLLLYGVGDSFPEEDIAADIVSLTMGYMTLRYKVIEVDPQFQTTDTLTYTDVWRYK